MQNISCSSKAYLRDNKGSWRIKQTAEQTSLFLQVTDTWSQLYLLKADFNVKEAFYADEIHLGFFLPYSNSA